MCTFSRTKCSKCPTLAPMQARGVFAIVGSRRFAHSSPNINQALLEIGDISHFRLVDTFERFCISPIIFVDI